jgi:lysophospholipase L1-like esterase
MTKMGEGYPMKKVIVFLITGVLFFSGTIPARGVTRIMPLGDSITNGWYVSVYRWGYRKPLYDLLTSNNYDFDFVGSQVGGSFADPNHEGHDGWTAGNIYYFVTGWLNTYQPDVVMLHIGTNDVIGGSQDANTVNAILNLIDAYEQANSRNVTVILALIINRRIDSPEAKRVATTQFNIDVNAMATNRIANGDDIIIVDMEGALNYGIGADLGDEVHPSDTGYAKMSQVWYSALTEYFNRDIFTISGYVIEPDGNTPVKGMFIHSDQNDINAITDTNGFYEFQVDSNWTGVATPQKEGFLFEPNGYAYSNVNQDLNNMDYIAAQITLEISGYVLEEGTALPINGVNVSADNGGGSAITNANGYYEIVVEYDWSGNVTPNKNACGIEPKSRYYQNVTADYADQNYTGHTYEFKITGLVRNICDSPVEGVLVDANNGGGEATTDSNGYYEVWIDEGWSGTVTPAKTSYAFAPVLRSYVDVQSDYPDQNFITGNTYDLDCDGIIGWSDVKVISENWLSTDPGAAGNFVEDGQVDFLDFAAFGTVWKNK